MDTSARQIDWNGQDSILTARNDDALDAAMLDEAAWNDEAVSIADGEPDEEAALDDLAAAAKPSTHSATRMPRRRSPLGGLLLLAGTTALGGLGGYAWSAFIPAQYEAAVEFVAQPDRQQIATLSGGVAPADLYADAERQRVGLVDPSLLQAVADRLRLQDDAEFSTLGAHPGMLSFAAFRSAFLPGGDLPATQLADRLSVQRAPDSFVIRAAVRTSDPAKSALLANTLAETFLGMPQGAAASVNNTHLADLEKAAEAAEREAAAYVEQNRLDPVLASGVEIAETEKLVAAARLRTVNLNAAAASARGATIESYLAGDLPADAETSGMRQARADYLLAQRNLTKISATYGAKHPQRKAAEGQLAEARRMLDAQFRGGVGKVQIDLIRAVEIEQQLASRLAQLKAERETSAPELARLQELRREADARRTAYDTARLEAERGSLPGSATGVALVAPAFAPTTPVGLSAPMLAAAGAGIGLVVGLAFGMAGLLRRREDRADDAHEVPVAVPYRQDMETVAAVPEPAAIVVPQVASETVEAVEIDPLEPVFDPSDFMAETKQPISAAAEPSLESDERTKAVAAGQAEADESIDPDTGIASIEEQWLSLLDSIRGSVANDNPDAEVGPSLMEAEMLAEEHQRQLEEVRDGLRAFRDAVEAFNARRDAEAARLAG